MKSLLRTCTFMVLLLHDMICGASIPQPDFPLILFTNPSSASYTAATGTFSIASSPWLALMDASGTNISFITGTGSTDLNVTINVVLNPADGSLVGGVSGDDLVVMGVIDATYNNDPPHRALLKGEIVGLTYIDDPSATDSVELRFHVTGGSLSNHPGFVGQDIGVLVTLENIKTVLGATLPTVSFNQNFTASAAKGNLGPIPSVPNTSCSVTIGDYVWQDLNHDGAQQANEPGIDNVTVLLKEAKPNGSVLQSITTAPGGPTNQSGYYQFAAQCGDYVVEVVPNTLPAGLTPTTPTAGGDATVDSNGNSTSISLPTDGTSDQTIDFGYQSACTGAIGDFVWQDTNLNGIQDSGEPGIDGVAVWLKDGAGHILDTAVTGLGGPNNQPGYYQFSGRCAGTYTVEVNAATLPTGFTATSSNVGGDQALDSNGSPSSVTLATDSSTDQTVDFGYKPPCSASIGNYVWNDANRNGIQDANEVGINGVQVLLLDSMQHQIATATTNPGGPGNPDGYYQFAGLCANTYYVKVDENTVPPGMVATLVNVGTDQTVDSNLAPTRVVLALNSSTDQTIDFGFYTPCKGAIGDYLWHDLNRDGIQNVGEPGINGITVNLKDSAGTIVATTVTGPGGPGSTDGYYQFTGLCADDYTVEVDASTLPAGYTPAPSNAGSDTGLDSNAPPTVVHLPTDNSSDQTIDFGYLSPCSGVIGDYIWEDQNQNGIQDATEPGTDGVTVQLKDSHGNVIATTVTNTGGPGNKPGYYQFNGFCGGTYTVVVDVSTLPPGFTATLNGVGPNRAVDSNGSPALVVLPSDIASDLSIDFGFKPPCTGNIGNYVWADQNQNGLQDLGETGINGVTVNLKNSSGTIVYTEVTYTNATTLKPGYYNFTGLCTGNYTVEVDGTTLPTGYTPSPTLVGADRSIDSNAIPTPVSLATNSSSDSTVDFGFVPPANLGDYVWIDANQDGIQDANELGLAEVTVELYQCGGSTVLASTTTGNGGLYGFLKIKPGSYSVKFYPTTLYPTFTTPKLGGNNALDSDANSSGVTACVTLSPGQTDNDLDAGLWLAPATASLGDFVWNDANKNGQQDSGEAGIPGVAVDLYNCGSSTALRNTTTGPNGEYLFSGLPPGCYEVGFATPSGYTITVANVGSDDTDSDLIQSTGRTNSYTLAIGQALLTVDAGFYQNSAGCNQGDKDGDKDGDKSGDKSDDKDGWGDKSEDKDGWGDKSNDKDGWGDKSDDKDGWGDKSDEKDGWGDKSNDKDGWGDKSNDKDGWGDKSNDKDGDKSGSDPCDHDHDPCASGDKSDDKSGDKSGYGWGDKSDDKSGHGWSDKSDDKSGDKDGDKSDSGECGDSGDKDGDKSDDKSGDKSGDKSDDKSGHGWGDKSGRSYYRR